MTTQTAAMPATAAAPVSRTRAGLLFGTLAGTAVLTVALIALWPASDGNWYTYADIAPLRDRWFLVVTVLAITVALAVPAQALATMTLVRARGSGWATTGGVMLFLGAALQVTGMAGWAALYYFATGPGLDPAAGTAFLDRIAEDGRLFLVAEPGVVLVTLGTAVQAIGLWRSRAVPRWVPILALVGLPTFFVPTESTLGVAAQVLVCAPAVAIGWYAWRRAGERK
jgi:hypothetical protein